jgi:response regulator of citrate/malate metabolism
MKLQCLIVDDDPESQKSIGQFIEAIDFLELAAITESPSEASELIKNKLIDLIFLDIDILKLNGADFLQYAGLSNIFLTVAGVEYPVEAFSLEMLYVLIKIDVTDYFVKPISFELFLNACNTARENYSSRPPQRVSRSTDERFFSVCDNLVGKVFYNDLRYAEAMLDLYAGRK